LFNTPCYHCGPSSFGKFKDAQGKLREAISTSC
jgi:hypothetical protein